MNKDTPLVTFLFFIFCVPTWILWWAPVSFIAPRSVAGAIDMNFMGMTCAALHLITCVILVRLDIKDGIRAEKEQMGLIREAQERNAKKKYWRPNPSA